MAVQDCSITVGLPVCNAMPYLPEAVESLLSQTATNFRILAIVDGGRDESLEYLLSVRDPRLRVIPQVHCGLAYTLNRMLREAETPWLVRQDADDVSHPTRLARLLDAIAEHPDAGMFYSLAEYYPPDHSLGHFRCTRGTPQQLRQIVQSGYLLSICHPSVALNVQKTLALGGYRNLRHAEDADLWWRMALQYEIYLVPEVLVGFRHNTSSISSQHSYTQELHGLYIQYLLVSHLIGKTPQPLSQIAPLLQAQISDRRFAAKQHLRHLNMHLAANRYLRAMASLGRSFLSSPGYLLQRIREELLPLGKIANGISPDVFYRSMELFWP
ncbi:MAG: glycosyltransferase [Acidobacterium ailaaui]|nr:glycosyltransferase [Pseudacidobacterium ailaaui]MCL6463708.1 glycosyltransferase [Pseudacidobacterium ailaaui]